MFVSWLACVGRFFEVLIGAKPGSLWRLLSTVGILYALEPILTVLFVTNMNFMWEKVMSRLRAQIFGRLLIQKVISYFYRGFQCWSSVVNLICHYE